MMHSWKSLRPIFVVLLSSVLIPALTPAQVSARNEKKDRLKIKILEGEGAINNASQRVARDPVVQVLDENNKPIAGAIVTFVLPGSGPSGIFANGAATMIVPTNASGIATATGLTTNAVPGSMSINVSASFGGGMTGSTTISSTVAATTAGAIGAGAAAAGLSLAAKVAIVAVVVGAAAAGGVALATSGSDAPPPPTTTTVGVTVGGPTVGPPGR